MAMADHPMDSCGPGCTVKATNDGCEWLHECTCTEVIGRIGHPEDRTRRKVRHPQCPIHGDEERPG